MTGVMQVYLIRHAQSEGNVMDFRKAMTVAAFNAMLDESPQHPLTAEGERQAAAVSMRLRSLAIDRLYSSPFLRAMATATTIGDAIGQSPIVVDALREVVPNALPERLRTQSLRRLYLHSFAAMLRSREYGATWRSEYRRAKQAWATITAEPATTVAAVSHGWLISLILISLRRDPQWRILQRDTHNAGISIIARRDT